MDQLSDDIDARIIDLLTSSIRTVPDFPKPGIQFKDITPLLKDRNLLELTNRLLSKPFRGQHIDYVVGLESRGFLFGSNIAQDLHAGFVPVRKPDKLPYATLSQSYELEYGTDSVEIHADSIEKGAKVLIHDDLVATGGSAMAASRLVQKLGGEIVGYSFLISLEALGGSGSLVPGVPVHSLIRL
jgi:adenine phosphoribosyltransferase